jgi:hypothetical protein
LLLFFLLRFFQQSLFHFSLQKSPHVYTHRTFG